MSRGLDKKRKRADEEFTWHIGAKTKRDGDTLAAWLVTKIEGARIV